jgi:E3 ubiquitin-protein ligase HUWE1
VAIVYLHKPLEAPGGSILLRELANVAHLPDAIQSPQSTPLLHALSSCHAYIMMFVHVCKMGQVRVILFVRKLLNHLSVLAVDDRGPG